MEDIIKNVLIKLNEKNISIKDDSGRSIIAEKILESFQNKHIVFYTNLEEHNKQKIMRGL